MRFILVGEGMEEKIDKAGPTIPTQYNGSPWLFCISGDIWDHMYRK